jgi:hypothetical protein
LASGEVPHGLTAYKRGCRCHICRAANAAAQRRFVARREGAGRPHKYQKSVIGPDNPYPTKRHCECDHPAPFGDAHGEVRCLNCGHAPRPVAA